ncbi:Putative G1/S-specific cyclin [Gossypium arboreum]|uniref:Putative G1/S-specific cyclin n=1 Tax=Gossypium arboreum TaxID=29729 RepID=A0A0B0MRT3_GOSAR|nr:Putative G1/S-specific cyclin [Gossypium arboreum]
MHVPNMSYASPRLDADAMSQTWSYTGSHNVAEACPRHVLHWRTNHPMPWHEYPVCILMFQRDISIISNITRHSQLIT